MSTTYDRRDVLLCPTPLPSHALNLSQVIILPLYFLLLSPLSILIPTWSRDLKNARDPQQFTQGINTQKLPIQGSDQIPISHQHIASMEILVYEDKGLRIDLLEDRVVLKDGVAFVLY